jgi:hypothetical protein
LPGEDVTPDDCIEAMIEVQLCRVALKERHVVHRVIQGSLLRDVKRSCGPICADHLTTVADNLGCNEGNVANSTSDVENSHTKLDSRVEKELARKRFKHAGLGLKSLQFSIVMS